MREVSATEASRNFSAVLDSAEHGETVLVTRGVSR
ncbi:MAG: type II toxin-antitoxin system Phd/YefM family antitoxin [Pseudonocardiaceae bacterium]